MCIRDRPCTPFHLTVKSRYNFGKQRIRSVNLSIQQVVNLTSRTTLTAQESTLLQSKLDLLNLQTDNLTIPSGTFPENVSVLILSLIHI
eukprot:TRINITY_DN25304_c0_g1_i1.p1 TRINITY_DN25304_c0_g1~~TRINITY_DN25304_c0_g1_i1.p1  ORF type:complete len:103 (+),score=24.64 TRINITY_DN25304_c0_g1_i1:45-311(+)